MWGPHTVQPGQPRGWPCVLGIQLGTDSEAGPLGTEDRNRRVGSGFDRALGLCERSFSEGAQRRQAWGLQGWGARLSRGKGQEGGPGLCFKASVCMCVYVCTHVYVRMCVCMCAVCMCMCVHTGVWTCVTCVFMCTHVCWGLMIRTRTRRNT